MAGGLAQAAAEMERAHGCGAASGSSGGTLPVGSVCGGGKEREASRVMAESDLGYPKVVEAK